MLSWLLEKRRVDSRNQYYCVRAIISPRLAQTYEQTRVADYFEFGRLGVFCIIFCLTSKVFSSLVIALFLEARIVLFLYAAIALRHKEDSMAIFKRELLEAMKSNVYFNSFLIVIQSPFSLALSGLMSFVSLIVYWVVVTSVVCFMTWWFLGGIDRLAQGFKKKLQKRSQKLLLQN
jgi:hypothetical protein